MTVECSKRAKTYYRLKRRDCVHSMEENNLGAKEMKEKRSIPSVNYLFPDR